MNRVFVVQQSLTKNRQDQLVARFDLTPAKKYGELIDLLGPSAKPFNAEPVVGELSDKLKDFNDRDYLLCVGNPILIGWATAIAANYNGGFVKMLQWSGTESGYIPVEVQLF